MLTGLDHVTIAVSDLEPAVAAHSRLLGAPPTWQGEHVGLGTQGALFGLDNGLLELVAPNAEPASEEGLRAWLHEHGEGLLSIAFATADVAACHALLKARGLAIAAPELGEARSSEGESRRYRVSEISPRRTRGVRVSLVERPDTGALRGSTARPPDALGAIDHVVLRTSDPDAAIALYGEQLGIRLALDRDLFGTRMLFFRVGGVTLEVVQDPRTLGSDVLAGLAYRTGDLDAACARILHAGFAVSGPRDGRKPGTRVLTVKDGTSGVPTLVIRDPARD
jgi:catechol 2,3-dioxygenase-like lactoylglutathione lyase family enzyme